MDRRKQETVNGLNGGQFNIQPSGDGKAVTKLVCYVTGTNEAATVGTVADLGSVIGIRNGEQVFNVAAHTLANILDINGGQNYLSSVSGGAFAASFIIPLHEKDLESGLEILDEKEFNFEYLPGAAGVFTNLSVTVYAEYEEYPELGVFRILRDNQTFSGAMASENFNLNKNNITAVYLNDVDSVITSVALQQNGKQTLSEQPFILLEIDTLANNQLEVSTFPLVKVTTHTPGVPKSTVNRDSILSLSSSASGQIEITTCSMVWN